MISTFWTNTIWYILLAAVSLVQLIFIMVRAKRRNLTFAFFLTMMGIAFSLETVILIFLKSYEYYPMIFAASSDPFNDSIAGNIFSQFSVSVSVLLAIVLNLKYYWYFILAAIYGVVEELFLSLGIYRHNWYRTWMTVAMFPIAIWMTKRMYSKLIQGIKPISYYGYVILSLFPLYSITILWGLQLMGYLAFNTTILHDPINSRYLIALIIYFISPSVIMMIVYFGKFKFYWKVLAIAMLYGLYYSSYRFNLVWVKQGCFVAVSTATIVWMYLSIFLADRLYGGL